MKDPLEVLIHQLVEKGIRYDLALADFEKKFIMGVLQRSKGNQSRAAQRLGMHRNTLRRKIVEYNLESTNWKMAAQTTKAAGRSRACQ